MGDTMTPCSKTLAVWTVLLLNAGMPRAVGQDIGAGGVKENLDLPLSSEDSSEDESFEAILFYGQTYEGDGFFFTFDHSGTMTDSGELAIAKREVVQAIEQLSERSEFSMNSFSSHLRRFPSNGRPARATVQSKSDAVSFVEGVVGGGGTCCRAALLDALRSARFSTAKRKLILYVSDGGGTCGGDEAKYLEETLNVVTHQNGEQVPIHTFGVLMEGRAVQEDFLQRLAAANGGTYRRVE